MLVVAVLLATLAASAGAQSNAIVIGSVADEQLRMRQLRGDTSADGTMLRSLSSLTPRLAPDSARRFAWQVIGGELRYTHNSDLPYSLNDGPLWAGRGSNVLVTTGVRAEWGPVRLFLVPELAASDNQHFDPPFVDLRSMPGIPGSMNPYSSRWHPAPQSIDMPWRFGDRRIRQLTLGQSTLSVDVPHVTLGGSTENEWWGPGMRNALVLSNNARGFPHLFARTAAPIRTRVGSFEARWLAGWLNESPFFDSDTTNQRRSIAAVGVSWRPFDGSVVVGATRSVFAFTRNRSRALGDFLNVFNDVGQPNAVPLDTNTVKPGQDQLLSLFWRWIEPNDRFEFYGEWARAEFPVSLRDFLVQPNHTQGYTLGLQWLGQPVWRDVRLRAQGEVTYVEQSTTFRQRLIGSWYTSRVVAQGYTNEGQPLGAAIGPGSSSQFVALDAVAPSWQIGPYLTRVRWQEDARSQFNYAYDDGYRGLCEHDVSFLSGIRGTATTRWGSVAADYSSGWRLNVFFEHPGQCMSTFPSGARDVRTQSLTLRLTPATFR